MAHSAVKLLFFALLSLGCLAKEWHSGQIVSLDQFLYGAFEFSAKGTAGSGAVLGMVLIVPDPLQGWQEIGWETFGRDTTRYQTQIIVPSPTLDPDGQPRIQYPIEGTNGDLAGEFHTYRIEWTPSYISWLLDGSEVRRETDASKFARLFDASQVTPMEIRVTLWAGFSNWSGQIDPSSPPTDAVFDYISVESWSDSPSNGGGFTPLWRDDFNSFDSARWRREVSTDVFTVNDFTAESVTVADGNLVLSFNRA